jgi:hypothetical protein
MAHPCARSIAVVRREPRKGHAGEQFFRSAAAVRDRCRWPPTVADRRRIAGMQSSSHWQRIDNRPCWRSMSFRRSGALIFRAARLKSRAPRSVLGVQLLDLTLAVGGRVTIAAFRIPAPPVRATAFSRRRSGSDEPDSAGPDQSLSFAPATLPARSWPSIPRQSSVSFSA